MAYTKTSLRRLKFIDAGETLEGRSKCYIVTRCSSVSSVSSSLGRSLSNTSCDILQHSNTFSPHLTVRSQVLFDTLLILHAVQLCFYSSSPGHLCRPPLPLGVHRMAVLTVLLGSLWTAWLIYFQSFLTIIMCISSYPYCASNAVINKYS